jgi:hypothetical protein
MADRKRRDNRWYEEELEAFETDAAAAEAAAIGGRAGDEELDPANRPLVEGGEGVAEGFELAEEGLIDRAELGDGDPLGDAYVQEAEVERAGGEYGEADEIDTTEGAEDRP